MSRPSTNPNVPTAPHFIGIGAARSGSTWLFKNIELHPGVWLPRIKELHYFSRSARYHGPRYLEKFSMLKRLTSFEVGFPEYRRQLVRSVGSNVIHPSWKKLKWDCKYLLSRPSDDWYVDLFKQANGKISGEITPQYSVLDFNDTAALKALLPNVKIFFIMRDPVERAWSLVRYHEVRYKRPLTSLPLSELKELAMHPAIIDQSDYRSILANWRSVFPEDQFFLSYYDEIHINPNELIDRLLNFVGLDSEAYPSELASIEEVVNPSFDKSMPKDLRSFLIDFYGPKVEQLSKEEGGFFTQWLDRYTD